MKVGIHTWGSEGDVRPFSALADGLVAAGHEVLLAYSPADGRDYAARFEGVRYRHTRLGGERSTAELTRVAGEVFAERNPLRQLDRVVKELLEPTIEHFAADARQTAKWADVVVLHPFAHPLAVAAQVERKPMVVLYTAPLMPTKAIAPPGVPNLGPLNALAWRFVLSTLAKKLEPSLRRVREGFGVPHVGRIDDQLGRSVFDLLSVSPALFPRPTDWPQKVHQVGFLNPRVPYLDAIDPALEAFFADGPPPIYVTFGSMSAAEKDPAAVLALVERAVVKAGRRAIVQAEVGGSATKTLFRVRAAPHGLLFPRCAAIVHHGGAGTTQSAVMAGRPSVVVAHLTDQFLWGQQLTKLGVAPPHLTRRSLDVDRLARAIDQACSTPDLRTRAEALAASMRTEDGVRAAVASIERAQTATPAP